MNPQKITLYNNVTPKTITSSTDATPIVMTVTAHGFTTGDRVLQFGHTTNLAANGIFKVTVTGANTYSLQDEFTGIDVAGSGGGAGASGVAVAAPPVLLVSDFRNLVLQVGTSGTSTMTLKVPGSLGKPDVSTRSSPRFDYPNMGGTIVPSNPYQFVQLIDLDTASAVNGATGIVVSGTDINKNYEVNTNALKYLTVIPVTWTAGALTIVALLTSAKNQ